MPVTDTIKRTDTSGHVAETPPRDQLVSVQTPQAFRFGPLLEAHEAAAAALQHGFTDDAALMEWAGHTVATFRGDPANVKLTHAEDFLRANARHGAVLVTRGEEGMTLFTSGGGVTHIPTVAREVYDVTGAGDTVIATLALALVSGAELAEGAILANHAAGVVVGKLGTATLSREELLATFE